MGTLTPRIDTSSTVTSSRRPRPQSRARSPQPPVAPVDRLGLGGRRHPARSNRDPHEPTAGLRAEFDAVAMTAYCAIADDHVLTGLLRQALQHNAVIVRINGAALDTHAPATVHIQPIVVVRGMIEHVDVGNEHVLAEPVMLHPASRVPQPDALDSNIAAPLQMEALRAIRVLLLERVPVDVDHTPAPDRNVLEVVTLEQGARFRRGGALRILRARIVIAAPAPEPDCPVIEQNAHPAAKANRPRNKPARWKIDATARFRAPVDRLLNRLGAQRFPI